VDALRQSPGRLLAAIGVGFVAGILLWSTWPLYPFKLLVVLMHESGHAAAMLLVGGTVQQIHVDPLQGGYTLGLAPPGLLRQIVISSAGYVGSTISGCAILWAALRSRDGRWPLLLLALWTGAVGLLWVRDGFTLLFVAAATVALALAARFAPPGFRRGLLVFLGTFSVSYALFDIRDDLLRFGSASGGMSDADALARATYIPALVWGIGWGALSLVLVALTLRQVVSPRPARTAASARPSTT
jgi:hypothetical protein